MNYVTLDKIIVTKTKFRLTVDEGSAEVVVSFDTVNAEWSLESNLTPLEEPFDTLDLAKVWTLEANFVPLEQREFVDALDRALPFEVIAKDGRGGCLIQGPVPEGMTRAEVVDRIQGVFANTIVTG